MEPSDIWWGPLVIANLPKRCSENGVLVRYFWESHLFVFRSVSVLLTWFQDRRLGQQGNSSPLDIRTWRQVKSTWDVFGFLDEMVTILLLRGCFCAGHGLWFFARCRKLTRWRIILYTSTSYFGMSGPKWKLGIPNFFDNGATELFQLDPNRSHSQHQGRHGLLHFLRSNLHPLPRPFQGRIGLELWMSKNGTWKLKKQRPIFLQT